MPRSEAAGEVVMGRRWPGLLIVLCLLVVACGQSGGADPTAPGTPSAQAPIVTPPQAPTSAPTQAPRDPAHPASPGAETTDPPTAGPATPAATPPSAPPAALPQDIWRTAGLLDVRSGETLTVNELTSQGLLVVIEPMAIWCSSCRTQQNEARAALASLGRDDIVYISLDVDPNETEPDLARYADEREYPWHFAVASRDVARSLAETFGDQVLSPPSTPKIVIEPAGGADVSFGIKRAAELEADFVARLP